MSSFLLLSPFFKAGPAMLPNGAIVSRKIRNPSFYSGISDMTCEGFGEMIEGDTADTGTGQFRLTLMGVREEGLACAGPAARTLVIGYYRSK
jgi:hypothetical protein